MAGLLPPPLLPGCGLRPPGAPASSPGLRPFLVFSAAFHECGGLWEAAHAPSIRGAVVRNRACTLPTLPTPITWRERWAWKWVPNDLDEPGRPSAPPPSPTPTTRSDAPPTVRFPVTTTARASPTPPLVTNWNARQRPPVPCQGHNKPLIYRSLCVMSKIGYHVWYHSRDAPSCQETPRLLGDTIVFWPLAKRFVVIPD